MWQTCVSMQSLLEIWCSTCLAVHFVAGVYEALWLAQSIWNVLQFFQLPKDSVKAHTFTPCPPNLEQPSMDSLPPHVLVMSQLTRVGTFQ